MNALICYREIHFLVPVNKVSDIPTTYSTPFFIKCIFLFQSLCRHDQWSLWNKMKQAENGWLNLEQSLIRSR